MAKRGRPKGSKNKKAIAKEESDKFKINPNAKVWYEIWYKATFYGWSNRDQQAGIISLLHSNSGNLKKAKKMDYNNMYFPFLEIIKPTGTKKKPIHITRTI